MQYDLPPSIQVEAVGPVRIVRMNRPDRYNAVDVELHGGLANVWPQLKTDVDARAVVVTGNGRAFSAGGDFDTLDKMSGHDAESERLRTSMVREAEAIVDEMWRFPLPIIAAVNGPAVGLGSSVASGCDIVIMSEEAYFADPHVPIGLVAGDGATAIWPLVMSMMKAKEYLLTGDRIPATEAHRIGLANKVVPADAVLDTAVELAQRIAGLPAFSVQQTKRALNMHFDGQPRGVLRYSVATESESMTSNAHREIVNRMLEKHYAARNGSKGSDGSDGSDGRA